MATKYNPSMIKSKLGWSNSFNPNAAFPLDFRVYFGSLEDAQAAANTAVDFGSTESAYYYGMQLYVFDGTTCKTYLINGDHSLTEIGANNDQPMLFVADQTAMLALTEIKAGQQVYREDTKTIWIYKGTNPADLANWVESAAQNDTVWEGTNNKVTFEAITRASYKALETKPDNKLYFVTDSGKIYKGATDVTRCVNFIKGGAFPAIGDAEAGKLYVDQDSLEVRMTADNTKWLVLIPGYITDGTNWAATADDGKLATKAVIKEAIQKAIDDINITIAYDKAIGKLTVGTSEATLEGVAHDVEWNSDNAILTIKQFGTAEPITVNIGKDKFVSGGKFYASYPETDPQYTNVIVLEVTNGDPIIIPADSLVDVYTADNTKSKDITVTITDDKKIYAAVRIDPVEGNALVSGDNGLKVDLSAVTASVANKVDKVADGTEGNLASLTADGGLADSTYSVQLEGALESGKKLPTAALVATAIAAAVEAAQGTLQNAIDTLKNTVDGHTTSITQLQETVANIAENILGDGAENQVIFSTAKGIKRSGKTVGTTISDTPSDDVIATEKMVADALSWAPLE